ncbi:MAG: hypothetical protein ABIO55_11110 [Ginsengibacter sp.]
MRLLLALIITFVFTSLNAQTIFPGFQSGIFSGTPYQDHDLHDSSAQKKWFVSRAVGVTAGYSFFKGGNARILSVPLSVQLNRRLNNNLYAFANVSVAPSYISFSNAFSNAYPLKANNNNNFFKTGNMGGYSSAALGLMYINDNRTFSISGSIGIEKNNYPVYYYNPANTTRPNNNPPAQR